MIDQNSEKFQPPDRETRQRVIFSVFVIALTFLAYSSALSATYIWDDDDYILNNATLRSVEGLWNMWFEFGSIPQYYPLVHTTFWIEFQLWGLNPQGYHVVNLMLHAGSAYMLGAVIDGICVKNGKGHWLTAGRMGLHGSRACGNCRKVLLALFRQGPLASESIVCLSALGGICCGHASTPGHHLGRHGHRPFCRPEEDWQSALRYLNGIFRHSLSSPRFYRRIPV